MLPRDGWTAAQIPIKDDPVANEAALGRVRADKLREVKAEHDGTRVAHPGLVPVAKDIFDAHMRGPNQLDVKRSDVRVSRDDLLSVPEDTHRRGPAPQRAGRRAVHRVVAAR